MQEKIRNLFHETELPKLQEKLQATSIAGVDTKLREFGSSLAKQEQAFFENVVAREWLRDKIEFREEVTHDELLNEYHAQSAKFQQPARVRWERIMIRFDRCSDRAEAYRQIAALGEDVMNGAALPDVARRGSHCPNAILGGQFDWTRQGSLASKKIDEVLFVIPEGQLSTIIEDAEGLHIVRVLERKAAGMTPFVEVQGQLAEEIRQRRFDKAVDQLFEKLRRETYVWSVPDVPSDGPGPLADAP